MLKKTVELKLIYRILAFVASSAVAVFIFSTVVSDILPSNTGVIGAYAFLLAASYSLYLMVVWLMSRKIYRAEKYIFLILYTAMFIALLLSRDNSSDQFLYINLRIGYFKDAHPIIKYFNLLILVPVGFTIHNLYRLKIIHTGLLCTFTVTILEILQYLLKKGTFDINDIILNSLGFIIGAAIFHVYKKRKDMIIK